MVRRRPSPSTRPAAPAALRRSSLREQVAEALREEMMSGRLPAGRDFTVKQVAEHYGVSATPAREALVDLTAQGLLRVEHHRGFAVPVLGWEDFAEIVETRMMLADAALRRPDVRLGILDGERLASVRRRAEAAHRAVRTGELGVLVGCDRRFWAELAALLGTPRLCGYLDWLRVQAWMFAASHLRGRTDLDQRLWTGQLELIDRVEAGDRAGVLALLHAYSCAAVRLMAELSGAGPAAAERVTAALPGPPFPGPALPREA